MLFPLLIGAVIATFAPDSAKFFGSFTGALFTGGTTILAVFYVCMGASIDIKATPYILKKGGVLLRQQDPARDRHRRHRRQVPGRAAHQRRHPDRPVRPGHPGGPE